MGYGLRLINLVAKRHLRQQDYKLVLRKNGAHFYVASSARTRRFFDDRDVYAFAIGEYVFGRTRKSFDRRTITHELVHVEQARSMGLWFPLLYTVEHLVRGYEKNCFEVAAYKAERRRSK